MDDDLFRYAMDVARSEPLEVPENGAVFFSGGASRRLALQFCRKSKDADFKTILTTPPWRRLNDEKIITPETPLALPQKLVVRLVICERFCEAAKGNVVVFSKPAKPHRTPHGTFFDFELPKILENENVQTINSLPKVEYVVSVGRQDLLPEKPQL